jgi:hypothetical protein
MDGAAAEELVSVGSVLLLTLLVASLAFLLFWCDDRHGWQREKLGP